MQSGPQTGPWAQAGSDSSAAVLQLPHMTGDVLRKLGRRKARALGDLLNLPPDELLDTLTCSGAPCWPGGPPSACWPLQGLRAYGCAAAEMQCIQRVPPCSRLGSSTAGTLPCCQDL